MWSKLLEEDDLASRIKCHVEARPSNEKVAILWKGYLAGLFEWGRIDFEMYKRLDYLLPDIASTEIAEIFLEPDWIETSALDDEEYYDKINNLSRT